VRILFFSHYFPPEVNAPAARTFEHCLRWARAGHEVTVVTCNPNCPDGVLFDGYRNRLNAQTEWIEGVRVVRVWSYVAPNAGTARRILNYLSYAASAVVASLRLPRPDVVIATSPQFFCGWAGVWASRLKRAPLVLEIRDIWPESIEAVGALRNRMLLRYLEFLERRMYRAAREIVTVGNGYRENILGKIGNNRRISVITNGVDLTRFAPTPPNGQFLKKWRLEGKFVCSYLGTIGMAHGLDVVLDAARRLQAQGRDDIRFVLAGDGAARRQLMEAAQTAGLNGMVVFPGRLSREEAPAVLASSHASLVHLKKCELFTTVIPSKIFETMAMGRPIIMGVEGESRDIVLDAGAGLPMEPNCPDSLVACVIRLADDPALLQSLGDAGRRSVAERFSRDVLAGRYLELLTSVVNGHPTTLAQGERGALAP
jgi:glycosyltransferase involved in cell wall biosynthesis